MARDSIQTSRIQNHLTRTRIAHDLLVAMRKRSARKAAREGVELFDVIIEFNRDFPSGPVEARNLLEHAAGVQSSPRTMIAPYTETFTRDGPVSPAQLAVLQQALEAPCQADFVKSRWTDYYLFARLTRDAIITLASWTLPEQTTPLVYKIWKDHKIEACVTESVRTVKADAARTSFAAAGQGIVWAVADTGIDGSHPHFRTLATLELPPLLKHHDFTRVYADNEDASAAALVDEDGHGTHVAGIIAGRTSASEEPLSSGVQVLQVHSSVLEKESVAKQVTTPYKGVISGVAPYCKLVSLKVLDKSNQGNTSNLLAAIGYIQHTNKNGTHLQIHGLNISLGYTFDPEWFAAGQSPLCVEVDRLVRSGVCVVVAAGNAGYGLATQRGGKMERASHLGTIMDPGNAALAMTVGATHRTMPHRFGVSYFSSKGPTADGRMKPDLVAPGERIVSCALSGSAAAGIAPFCEYSGTSQAAPHVSGAVAAFLSVRSEFRGHPEQVKQIFLNSTTDLKRRPEFQGAGLLDLMRALQSI